MKKLKIIKILVLVLLIFGLTGCGASYSMKIDDINNIEEEIFIFSEKTLVEEQVISGIKNALNNQEYDCTNLTEKQCQTKMYNSGKQIYIKMFLNDYANKYYKKLFDNYEKQVIFSKFSIQEKFDYGNNYGTIYKNKIDINNPKYSLLASFSNNYSITNENNILKININGANKDLIGEVDKFDFSITTPYKTSYNNATRIKRNNENYSYIWEFTKNDNLNIEFEIDLNENIIKKRNILIEMVIIFSILLFVIFTLMYIATKSKKNNKI